MPRRRVADPARLGFDDRVDHGRHRALARGPQHAVEQLERNRGGMVLQRVGAQGRAHLAHQRRRANAVAGHVPDGQPDAAAGQREHVVPVSADLVAGGQVARGGRRAGEFGQAVGQQAALQGDRTAMLSFQGGKQAGPLDGRCGSGGRQLQHDGVRRPELAGDEAADVEHSDHRALHHERDAEQGPYAALAQDGVHDVGLAQVHDGDRRAFGRDSAGEPPAERDAHTLPDLLLEPLGRAGYELGGLLVDEQDRGGVDVEHLADAHEQLVEQRLEAEIRQGGIAQAIQISRALRRRSQRAFGRAAEEHLTVARPGLAVPSSARHGVTIRAARASRSFCATPHEAGGLSAHPRRGEVVRGQAVVLAPLEAEAELRGEKALDSERAPLAVPRLGD